MEQYKETVSKLTPPKLVNALLKLNEELANVKPEDAQLKSAISAKIVIVQDLISKLKKDTTSIASETSSDKIRTVKNWSDQSRVILVKKLETEFNKLEVASDEDKMSVF